MKEKLAINIISQIISNLLYISASFSLFLRLDAMLLGIWAFSISVINISFLFMNLGFDIIHLQYSNKSNSIDYFGTYFLIKIVLIGINCFVTLIVITILQLWSNSFIHIIIIILFSKIAFQLAKIFNINLKSRIKIFKAELPFFIITVLKSMLIFILSFNIAHFQDPLLFLSVSILALDISYVCLIVLISKGNLKFTRPQKRFFIAYFKDVKYLIYFSIIFVLSSNLGNLLLAYSIDLESLGYYSFINNYIINALLMFSGFFIETGIVIYSIYFEKENFNLIKRTTEVLCKYFSFIYLSIIIIVYVNGETIFKLFFPMYINSLPVLYILIIIPYAVGITRPFSIPLIAGKRQKIKYNISSLTHVLTIILMSFFIPSSFLTLGLGNIGYALAQTLPWILWMILNIFYSNKYFNLKPKKRVFGYIPIAFLTFFLAYSLKIFILDMFLQNLFLRFITSSASSLGLFIMFLFIFKELKKEDLKFFSQLLRFKNYKSSILEEF